MELVIEELLKKLYENTPLCGGNFVKILHSKTYLRFLLVYI